MLVDPIESEYFIYMYLLSEFQWRFVKLHLELLSYYHCNRDKQREKQRQLKIQTEEPKQSKLRRPPRSQAWSKQKERKDRKKKRREVKEISRKRKAQDAEAADEEEEEEDFQDDVKLMKKLKRGKVYNVNYKQFQLWPSQTIYMVEPHAKCFINSGCNRMDYKLHLHQSDFNI